MPYIPHTETDVQEMLATIGVTSIEQLFDEIPDDLKIKKLPGIPESINEMQAVRLLSERANQDNHKLNFMGAGAYSHHIPAAVWDIAARGEYMTAYTPYQAEASQGSLQLIWEFQTMMASLMGLEVSNASLYDGANALVEAVLMAARIQGNQADKKIIFVPKTLHPLYYQVLKTIVTLQDIILVDINYTQQGVIDRKDLQRQYIKNNITALIIPQPNFFGLLEEVDSLTDWAHENKIQVIAVVNPLAMAWLKPPGQWGEKGADIACGEAQPLGIPLSSGGPYCGFLCTKKSLVRQMPGRIVGKTVDNTGKMGFVLTLQAREQHIRRAKATSNICTNQGLLVTAATIYMSLLGPEGLKQVAKTCHAQARYLLKKLSAIPGVEIVFPGLFFHEFVIKINRNNINIIFNHLSQQGILAGVILSEYNFNLKNSLLICVTETKTQADLDLFVSKFKDVVKKTP